MLRVSGRLIAILAILGAVLWGNQSRAQDPYPARTVRIVVPSAPGSTTDTLARIVADQLGRRWGKSVIVENVAGGAMRNARFDQDRIGDPMRLQAPYLSAEERARIFGGAATC